MKNFVAYTFILLIFSYAQLASAKSEDQYVYLGFAAGGAKTSDDSIFTKREQSASILYFGYVYKGWIGVEVGSFGMIEEKDTAATPPVTNETSVAGTTSQVVVRIPVANTVSAHFGTGIIDWKIAVDGVELQKGSGAAYTAGINWYFGTNWSLRVEGAKYTKIGAANADINQTRLGITYNFF